MLNWLLGGEKPEDDNDDDSNIEAPDTPAPVFVARAFKSALFGTPAPPSNSRVEFEVNSDPSKKKLFSSQSEDFSPKKPLGILMTPGTATTSRKTVSFGNEVLENEKSSKTDSKVQISDIGQEIRSKSPESISQLSNLRARKTSLTLQMEKARELKPEFQESRKIKTNTSPNFSTHCTGVTRDENSESQSNLTRAQVVNENALELTRQIDTKDNDEGDVTIDLNKPFSLSGKYWKSEFENYQQDAKLELRKLLASKEMVKSYAKIKDEHSINLAEKLKEEQQKVIAMEEMISKLSAKTKLASDGIGTHDDSPILVKELARQTARAVQYKEQVEEFKKLMEQNGPFNTTIERKSKPKISSPDTENQANFESNALISGMQKEIKRLTEILQEKGSLDKENKKLREINRERDNIINQLIAEKKQLEREIFEPDENRRLARNERCTSILQAHQKLQVNQEEIKNQFKIHSAEAEHQIKNSHGQASSYQKENGFLNFSETKIKELQQQLSKKSIEYDSMVEHYEKKLQILKSYMRKETFENSQQHARESHISTITCSDNDPNRLVLPEFPISESSIESPHLKFTDIESHQQQQFGFLRVPLSSDQNVSKIPSNVVNDHVNSFPHDSLNQKSSLSEFKPTSPKPLQNQDQYKSPRPSIFRFESSQPRLIDRQANPMNEIDSPNIISRKLVKTEGKLGRVPLPPERIEAAKRRLAEKKMQTLAAIRSNRTKNSHKYTSEDES